MSLFYEKSPITLQCKEDIDSGCPNHFHSGIEMSLIISGHHNISINNKNITLEAGDILFCNPYDFHSYFSPDKGKHIFIFIEESEYHNCFQNKKLIILPNALTQKENNVEIFEVAKKILSEQNNFNQIIRQGYINLIIGKILKFYKPIHFVKSNYFEISQVVHYINEHYKENISRESLAKQFGYSINYFSFMFKEYFNISIAKYINTIRYEYAKQEILNGNSNSSLSEIILSNGFNNTQTFYRLNKKNDSIYKELRNFHIK